jgi:hydrogenase maturation protease
MKILVLGIGNILLTDEGVGIHIVNRLAREAPLPEEVELMDGGTLSFTLAVAIESAGSLIVVDAADLQAAPGTWRLFQGDAMDAFLMGNHRSSVHEVGLTDLRVIALLAGHWPERRALLAVQPESVDWGEVPTPAVATSIPQACSAIRELISAWCA